VAMAVFDVDRFKGINDRHGHETGDRVLVELAGLLGVHLRATDLPARLGGDEFVILMPATTVEDALLVCRQRRARRAGCAAAGGRRGAVPGQDGRPRHGDGVTPPTKTPPTKTPPTKR
jgi:GGDEF domain-containing protein